MPACARGFRTSCFFPSSTRLLGRVSFHVCRWRTQESGVSAGSNAYAGLRELQLCISRKSNSACQCTSITRHFQAYSSLPLRVGQVSSLAVYSWRTGTVFLTSRVLAGPIPGGRCAATAGRGSACLWTPNCCFTGGDVQAS